MEHRLSFSCDYLEGAHPAILQRLCETNFAQTAGYGTDEYCESAREKIRAACGAPNAEIHFLVGGTQTNATVIDALLRSYEGVIAADTGHISVHEAGAIEFGGHKVLTLPQENGKITASQIRALLDQYEDDANRIFCWMLKRQHGWASHRNSVFAFVLCLVMAYCAEKFFGVADITGAYAAGLAVACTPKGTYIQTKYNPLGYLLLTPVFFASIGINVQITGLTGGMVVFSILLLLVSIISKLLGCGLGAKACQFTTRESIQVGVGMACRGEVALIVANRGLSMGVLSSAMMTPVVITVVCGTILTPILLKLSFRGHQETELVQNNIADRMAKHRQLDIITQQLLQQDEQMMKKN